MDLLYRRNITIDYLLKAAYLLNDLVKQVPIDNA